ncbi:histidine kinase [Anditalea andensis]|uniref:Signal transduction histidine kinase internal region domain-containing protein n=1 Tax=Anditalea andensis TaxID=1048983 RepID=A0A074LN58_9BACT|nr:histidine kinase [Anditalea andensis]KEO75347.1 hypothetical protein EL17_02060 [Anditalea andensis]
MNFIRCFLFFILIYGNFLSLKGQQYPSKHFTTLEGLPNNAIRSLLVDSRGLLWIGTENGLSVMENGHFTNFNESDGLAFNSCWAIAEDEIGHMWFGSYGGGVTMFDGEKFEVLSQKDGLINDRIHHLFSHQDKIYVGTSNGLSVIDIRTLQIVNVPESQSDHLQNFISGFFVQGDTLHYTTFGNGTYRIIYMDQQPVPIIEKIHSHHLIYSIGQFGDTIFSSNKGNTDRFSLHDFASKAIHGDKMGHSINWSYVKDKNKTLYVGAWGIYTKDGGIYKIENDNMVNMDQAFGVSSKKILAVAYDKERNVLYAGSNDLGLYSIRLDPSILYYPFEDRAVLAFEENANFQVILHHMGITLVNKKSGALFNINQKTFTDSKDNYVKRHQNVLPKHEDGFFELDFNIVSSDMEFYELHAQGDHFWVNTNIGIYEFNDKGAILNYLPVHSYCMGFTPEGKLLESNPYGGVRIFDDVSAMKFTTYSDQDPHTPVQLSKIGRADHALYFSSVFHGLYKYDKGEFTSMLRDNMWMEEKLKRLHYTEKGQLIIASEFGEVYMAALEPSFKIVQKIDRSEIIGNNILFLESYKENLIIGTERGLTVYNDGQIRFVDQEQGLLNRLFTSAKVMGDDLYLGTSKGYYIIKLNELLDIKEYSVRLALTEVNINHQPSSALDYSWFAYEGPSLELPYDQNTLLIAFKSVGHPFPEKLAYRYRLHPDAEWSSYRQETRIELPYLPYGTYALEVEAYDRHTGVAGIYPLIDFTIHPPMFLRSWFIITLIVLFLINIWALYIYRIRLLKNREKKKADIERRLAEIKLEALCSQMNPHFTFNAINSVQYYILKNDTAKAVAYLGKFSKLIRTTLDLSSKQRISLYEEISYLQSYVSIENSRIENRVAFCLEVDSSIDQKFTFLPPMLIQPFIENVFVHAFDSHHTDPQLHLIFSQDGEGKLHCMVKDNGMGINPARVNKFRESKGIKLVRERVQLLKGSEANQLIIDSKLGIGTNISLYLVL